MIRKHRLSLLVSFFVLVLLMACAGGGEEAATEAPVKSAAAEENDGIRPQQFPPDFDVRPGRGGASAAKEGDAVATAGPTIWHVGGKPAPQGPESKGHVNGEYIRKIKKLIACDLDSDGACVGEGTEILGFVLELTSGGRTKTLHAEINRSLILHWNLTPDTGTNTLLIAREPTKTGQLPLEFFWNSDTLKVIYQDGTTGTADEVACWWE